MSESAFSIERKERLGLVAIGGFFLVPAAFFFLFLWWAMRAPATLADSQRITIPRGTGFLEIGDELAERGIVRSALLFRLYAIGRGWAGTMQPGEYEFKGIVTIPGVARLLHSGPGDVTLTIPEGLSMYDIEERLVSVGLVASGDFVQSAHSPDDFADEFGFLRELDAESLEGFLFPDTYRFDPRTGADGIARKMLSAFEEKVWKELAPQFRESPLPIERIVTMAAMIEREASDPEDRRIISGILWKRFEAGMPLQVDATVIYAWKTLNPRWSLGSKNRLSLSDLKIDSPYNTYRQNGFPPGPIANPGLDAIRAALSPIASAYWYYLSTSDGTIMYAKTAEEHAALKAKFYR